MRGKQRARAVLGGITADRTPVFASTLAGAAHMRGVAQQRFHTDAETLAHCVAATSQALRLDGVYVSSDNWILYEALGGKVVFPQDEEPWGHGPLVKGWDDLRCLAIPDPSRSGRMPMMLAAAELATKLVGQDLYIEANIDSGPFQLALTLRGVEQGMIDLTDEPDRFHELLRFATEVVIAYGRAMAQTGVDGVQFGESSASLASVEILEEFILPYAQRVIAALKQSGVDAFLHVCGRSGHLLEGLVRSGADCLEIDSLVALEDVFTAVGEAVCVRGNVDTVLLLNGPEQTIREAAHGCLSIAGCRHGRLILSPGCGVPKMTPASHILALVDAAVEAAETGDESLR